MRDALRMTQQELARTLQVDQSAVSKLNIGPTYTSARYDGVLPLWVDNLRFGPSVPKGPSGSLSSSDSLRTNDDSAQFEGTLAAWDRSAVSWSTASMDSMRSPPPVRRWFSKSATAKWSAPPSSLKVSPVRR